MAAYFFASPIDIDVKLEGEENRKQVEIKGDKDKMIACPVYFDGDSVNGQVSGSVPTPYSHSFRELLMTNWVLVPCVLMVAFCGLYR